MAYTKNVTTGRMAKAVEMLRRKLGDSQRAFAKRVETTVTTVSRYENGRIEPSEQALRKLATIAESAGLKDLQDFFENQRKLGIIARVESLPSAGTQRRVSLDDLKRWQAVPHFAAQELRGLQQGYWDMLKHPLDPAEEKRLGQINHLFSALINNVLLDLSRQIEPYINLPERSTKAEKRTPGRLP